MAWGGAVWLFPFRLKYILQIYYGIVKGLGKIFFELAEILTERGFCRVTVCRECLKCDGWGGRSQLLAAALREAQPRHRDRVMAVCDNFTSRR